MRGGIREPKGSIFSAIPRIDDELRLDGDAEILGEQRAERAVVVGRNTTLSSLAGSVAGEADDAPGQQNRRLRRLGALDLQ